MAALAADLGVMPTLGWTGMRRALEYIGRRPIVTTWIGLQFNLFLYWRASEPYTLLDRLSHGFGILGAMSFLNTPGVWVVFPLAEVVDTLLMAGHQWGPSRVESDVTFLVMWILSAVVTYLFWTALALPGLRWLLRTSGPASRSQFR
jgi:hypothetical protein